FVGSGRGFHHPMPSCDLHYEPPIARRSNNGMIYSRHTADTERTFRNRIKARLTKRFRSDCDLFWFPETRCSDRSKTPIKYSYFKVLQAFILSCTTPIFHATSQRPIPLFQIPQEALAWQNSRARQIRNRHPITARNRSRFSKALTPCANAQACT